MQVRQAPQERGHALRPPESLDLFQGAPLFLSDFQRHLSPDDPPEVAFGNGDAGMARDSWICSSLAPPLIASFVNIRPCVRSAAASWDLALGEHRERDADKHKEQQEGDGEHNLPPLIAPVALETGVERDDRLLPPSDLDNVGRHDDAGRQGESRADQREVTGEEARTRRTRHLPSR